MGPNRVGYSAGGIESQNHRIIELGGAYNAIESDPTAQRRNPNQNKSD